MPVARNQQLCNLIVYLPLACDFSTLMLVIRSIKHNMGTNTAIPRFARISLGVCGCLDLALHPSPHFHYPLWFRTTTPSRQFLICALPPVLNPLPSILTFLSDDDVPFFSHSQPGEINFVASLASQTTSLVTGESLMEGWWARDHLELNTASESAVGWSVQVLFQAF